MRHIQQMRDDFATEPQERIFALRESYMDNLRILGYSDSDAYTEWINFYNRVFNPIVPR
jgi:hypothetical protein